jgi:hypothetical protein
MSRTYPWISETVPDYPDIPAFRPRRGTQGPPGPPGPPGEPATVDGILTLDQGIKIGNGSPSWGWRNLTGNIVVTGNPNDPRWTSYDGITTMRAYRFSATSNTDGALVDFQVPNDWVAGTDFYFYVSWSNAAFTPNTGGVMWRFEYTVANVGERIPIVQSISVVKSSPVTRSELKLSKTGALNAPVLSPGGLIWLRILRMPLDPLDTCTDPVFMHSVGIFYQSTNVAIKNIP